MTASAPPAVLKWPARVPAAPTVPAKDSPLCGPCKRALPPWLQQEVRRTWAAYLISYSTALAALASTP